MVSQCSVCDLQTPKLGKHYGATTCYPCRAFFRRAQVSVRRYTHSISTTTKQYTSIQCIHTDSMCDVRYPSNHLFYYLADQEERVTLQKSRRLRPEWICEEVLPELPL